MSCFRQSQRLVVCVTHTLGVMVLTFSTCSCVFNPLGTRAGGDASPVDVVPVDAVADSAETLDALIVNVPDALDAKEETNTTLQWDCEALTNASGGCCPPPPAPWNGPTYVWMDESGLDAGPDGYNLEVDAGLMVGLKDKDDGCKCGCDTGCATASLELSQSHCSYPVQKIPVNKEGCLDVPPGTMSIHRLPVKCSPKAGSGNLMLYSFRGKAYIIKEHTGSCVDGGVPLPEPTNKEIFLCLYANATNVSNVGCPDGLHRISGYARLSEPPVCKVNECRCNPGKATVCQWALFSDEKCTARIGSPGAIWPQCSELSMYPDQYIWMKLDEYDEYTKNYYCSPTGNSSLLRSVKGDEKSAWVLCCNKEFE